MKRLLSKVTAAGLLYFHALLVAIGCSWQLTTNPAPWISVVTYALALALVIGVGVYTRRANGTEGQLRKLLSIEKHWNTTLEEGLARAREDYSLLADIVYNPTKCHSCAKCVPNYPFMRLCAICGNKRCPHATDHRLDCTYSNDPGQPGSDYGPPLVTHNPEVTLVKDHDYTDQPGDPG